jgi:perosamine synthetase
MLRKTITISKPRVGAEERRAVNRVLRSGLLAQGPEVEAFESEFSAVVDESRLSVAVNSGTSGLHLALLASGIGPGDEVIVPSFTFAATANAVALTGATPVFADIAISNYCLSPKSIEAAITPRTAAIMPVHLYGHPAPMREIMSIARKHHLAVFEDAAQAHLAKLDRKLVGTFGDFAVFSFYPTKNMTSGEGGMVVCKDQELARKIRLLRNQGMEKQYQNEIVGYNNRMTDIHAAIGRAQLKKLPAKTAKRQQNARFLSTLLSGVETPTSLPGAEHVFHQFTIRIPAQRDWFVQELKERFRVGAGIYYPTPSHLLASLGHFPKVGDMRNTELASKEVVSLPVHPGLSNKDLSRIARGVNALLESIK